MTFYTDDCEDQARNFLDTVYETETEHGERDELMYQKQWEH